MKKTLTVLAFVALVATPAFARYIVVLKNGTRYNAKAKWTVVKGKAIVQLDNGQSLQLDPSLIDVAKSEQLTKIGTANTDVIDLNPTTSTAPVQQQPSLGSQIKLRTREQQEAAKNPPAAAKPAPAVSPIASAGTMPDQVLEKFDRAYENVGIYEKTVKSTGGRSVRAELTVDTEERVFNAISATSFLIVRNAGVAGTQIDMVELFMRTTNGGAAGRFQMSRADAEALDKRTISQQEYFVRKVLY